MKLKNRYINIPLIAPNSCFLKNIEKGLSGLYVELKTKTKPIARRVKVSMVIVQSKFCRYLFFSIIVFNPVDFYKIYISANLMLKLIV